MDDLSRALGLGPDLERRVIDGVAAGRYSLILGAGASTEASSEGGSRLPTASGLALELADHFSYPPSYTLSRLWEALPSPDREAFLARRFSNCQIDPLRLPLPRFVWRTIWNLNVDDVVQRLYSGDLRQQDLVTVTWKDPFSYPESLGQLYSVHLHGSVSRPDHGYIFSAREYGGATASPSPWGQMLADDLVRRPFFVIGCALDEFDIEHYLALRAGIPAEREPRPSLFIIDKLDPVLRSTALRYGLLPVEATAADFLQWLHRRSSGLLRTPLELIVPASYNELYVEPPNPSDLRVFHRQFTYLAKSELPEPREHTNFLRGTEPTWRDILQDNDILRRDVTEILDYIGSPTSSHENRGGSPRMIVVSSAPGSGKTAVVMRTALELAEIGWPTFFFSNEERLSPEVTARCLKALRKDPVIVVDAFVDHGAQISHLLEILERENLRGTLLVADRENELRRVRVTLEETHARIFRLRNLDHAEAADLVSRMRAAGLLGRHAGLTDASLIARATKRDLLVAVCEIAGNLERFDRILSSQWTSLSDSPLRQVLIAVSIAHAANLSLRFALAERCSGIDAGILLREIGSGVLSGLVFREGFEGEYLRVGHRVLAERLLGAVVDKDSLYDQYLGLAKALARYVTPATLKIRTQEARLGAYLLDYDLSVKPKLGSRSRDFYNRIRGGWAWNSRYWNQIALLEVDERDFPAAIQHAEHSIGIEQHPLTFTTLGKVYMESAAAASSLSEAREDFRRGRTALDEALRIARNWRFIQVHPYHTGVLGAIRFVRRWGRELSREEVEWVEALLREAMERYPRGMDWRQLAHQWRGI